MSDRTIYVITWNYHDKSSFGVVGAYTDPDATNNAMSLLKQHAPDKEFKITTCKENKPCE